MPKKNLWRLTESLPLFTAGYLFFKETAQDMMELMSSGSINLIFDCELTVKRIRAKEVT